MPSFYDLLKYAKTGVASPDMTAYDKMRALAMAGGAKYPVATITGVPPIRFRSDGRPLDNVTIIGNGQQTGTPSPDNIIMPTFCGKLVGADWTMPITCGGQTVPVYLGQVQTVRRIKKLVFDGTESWLLKESSYQATLLLPITAGSRTVVSSHYKGAVQAATGNAWINATLDTLFIADTTHATSLTAFKQWLASEYSAGHPVTIWYVLATPQTGIVNEPLCKIGDYADTLNSTDAGIAIQTARGSNTLTVDTTVQPSSVTITGHIKPVA